VEDGDVAAADGAVFVATGGIVVDVEVIDATDPDNPVPAGSFGWEDRTTSLAATWQGLLVLGGQTYTLSIPDGQATVLVFDARPPRLDALIASVEIPYPQGIALEGDLAYVAAAHSLAVVDVSTPESPIVVGSLPWGEEDYLADVAVAGDRACVAAAADGLYVVDVSDPEDPVLVGLDSSGGALDVAIRGDLAYVAGGNGLRIVDLADPTGPKTVGTWAGWGWAEAIAVAGDYAYLTESSSGLAIIDVSDPAEPVLAGLLPLDFVSGLCVSPPYVFLATGWGLVVVDASDPTIPIGMGIFGPSLGRSPALHGSVLYGSRGFDGIVAVDVSNPLEPDLLGGTTHTATALAASGDCLLAGGLGLPNLLLVLSPQCPSSVSVHPGPGSAALALPDPGALRVHPSPVSGLATIRVTMGGIGRDRMPAQVLDVQGRRVAEVLLSRDGAGLAGTWDGRGAAPGVYFVRVPVGSEALTRRITRID
jgi:hypothetical protein